MARPKKAGGGSLRKDLVGYSRAHARLRESLGPPQDYYCIDGCGRAATEWSVSPLAEKVISDNVGRRYSHESSDYDPRCHRCHFRYDMPAARERAL